MGYRGRAAVTACMLTAVLVAFPVPASPTTSVSSARILAMGGQIVVDRPIQFLDVPVLGLQHDVSCTALTGFTPNTQDLVQAVLHFDGGSMHVVARQGQAIPGAEDATFFRFTNLNGLGVPFFRFTTDDASSGIARFFGDAVDPVLGRGSPTDGSVAPVDFVAAASRLFVTEGDRLVTVDPGTKMLTEVIASGAMLDGRMVEGIGSTNLFPLSIDPSGNFAAAVLTLDGNTDAVTRFDLQTWSASIGLVENGPAPGFPEGVTVRFVLNSASINANGDWSVQTRLLGTGISSANDEVLFFFDADGALLGRVQEGMQVPDGAPGTSVLFPAPPLQGPAGAAFLHRQSDAGEMPRGIGFVDSGDFCRTLVLAGQSAPGGGVYSDIDFNMCMTAAGRLFFRATLESGVTVIDVIDTTDPEAQPEEVLRTGDSGDLPAGGTATITGISQLLRSSGQDGRPRSCDDSRLAVGVSLSGTSAIAVVDLDGGVSPSPTPSATATPSATPTAATSTPTGTATPSASQTPTGTPTGTLTSTSTQTPTTTATTEQGSPTPTQPATSTSTPSGVATSTPTRSATPTPTEPATHTPTTLADATPTPTFPPPPTPTPTEEFDFGDAPDNIELPGRPTPRYPTKLENNGARHRIEEGFFLGQRVDADADGQPDTTATGDDEDSTLNDEEGVSFATPLRVGRTARIVAVASEVGRLDAWIDFDADGAWTGTSEQVLAGVDVLPGSNEIDIGIAADGAVGLTFARFRLSHAGGLSFDGFAPDGEVEDYAVEILGPLRGDANCDDARTAADLPAVVQIIGTGVRSPCLSEDADGNGTVDASDLNALIGAIYTPP